MRYKGKHIAKKKSRFPILLLIILIGCGVVIFGFGKITLPSLVKQEIVQKQIPENDSGSTLAEESPDTPDESILHETKPVFAVCAATQTPLVPTEETTPLVMLENMAQQYEKNTDIVGWITVENTKLDYPVMYSSEDPEKYLHRNFKGEYSFAGLPFVDANCSINPESDNLLIYGHNMNDGSMFHSLIQYETKTYWQAHPIIQFSTLYEQREYEVMAAFYDRVYYKWEDCFKFYQFIDAEDEADYRNAVSTLRSKALYDTGVSAQYGDSLITLVTCAYHVENGRFVVVAREISSDN